VAAPVLALLALSAALTVTGAALVDGTASAAAHHHRLHRARDATARPARDGRATLQVRVQNARGTTVVGAAVTLSKARDRGTAPLARCTTGAGRSGECAFADLPLGRYVVAQRSSPAGRAATRRVILACACTSTVVLTDGHAFAGSGSGTIVVRKTGADGAPLAGATFSLYTPAGPGHRNPTGLSCTTTLKGGGATCHLGPVPSGPYLVVETTAPAGYGIAPPRWVDVVAGALTVPFHDLRTTTTGALTVHAHAPRGARLVGATFSLYRVVDGAPRHRWSARCATALHQHRSTCTMRRLRPGTYALVETHAPAGYRPAHTTRVHIQAGLLTTAVRVEAMLPGTGAVHVAEKDSDGSLSHVRFSLYLDRGGVMGGSIARSCLTGSSDGPVSCRIPGVAAGTYYVGVSASGAGHTLLTPQRITVRCQRTTRVLFVGPGVSTGGGGGGSSGGGGPPGGGAPGGGGPGGGTPGGGGDSGGGNPTTGPSPAGLVSTGGGAGPTTAPAVTASDSGTGLSTPAGFPTNSAPASGPMAHSALTARDAASAHLVPTSPAGIMRVLLWIAAALALALLVSLLAWRRYQRSGVASAQPGVD
jgi:hypothetical protein